ncbi:MAG TPA: hypothetical protein VGS20_03440 [Candidatus Acidoferrales bacterium]|nr:hypothetical protein [Candidatus Acidoferrales bacterium]
MRSLLIGSVGAIALCCAATAGAAAPLGASPQSPPAREASSSGDVVVTHHQILIHGKPLNYTAQAGTITLRDHTREPIAKMFFVSYAMDGGEPSARPLTFAWNGGPGSPSSMIQMGALGPRRLKSIDEYAKKPPPYELTDNESTWLAATDLVFVDPVGTGYSYPVKPEYGKQFWNVQGDIDSVAEFIRIYRTRYERWNSPLFVAGESYGTVRAAGIAEALERRDIPVTGVILISSLLDWAAARPTAGNDLPYVLILPSYTAAAFAHKKLAAGLEIDLQATLRKAESWTTSEYAAALMKGDGLAGAELEATAKQLARYTGLAPEWLEKNDLRVNMEQFTLHLLADKQEAVAHYDSRLASKAIGGEYNPATDPSLSGNGLGTLFVPYLRDELGFKTDAFYAGPFGSGWPLPAAPRGDWLALHWDYGSATTARDPGEMLAQALRDNKALHVFSASGYYDLSTPYLATKYAFEHMGLHPDERSRIEIKVYPGGHMMYMSGDNRGQLERDVTGFIAKAVAASRGGGR